MIVVIFITVKFNFIIPPSKKFIITIIVEVIGFDYIVNSQVTIVIIITKPSKTAITTIIAIIGVMKIFFRASNELIFEFVHFALLPDSVRFKC